jgi:hypothetical protein
MFWCNKPEFLTLENILEPVHFYRKASKGTHVARQHDLIQPGRLLPHLIHEPTHIKYIMLLFSTATLLGSPQRSYICKCLHKV